MPTALPRRQLFLVQSAFGRAAWTAQSVVPTWNFSRAKQKRPGFDSRAVSYLDECFDQWNVMLPLTKLPHAE